MWFAALGSGSASAGPCPLSVSPVRRFTVGAGVEVDGNGVVTRWEDQSVQESDATATRDGPFLVTEGNREALEFRGGQALDFDGSALVDTDYTVFVVAQRSGTAPGAFYLGGSRRTDDENLVFGYENDTTLRLSHFGNSLDAEVLPLASDSGWRIQAFGLDQSSGRAIFDRGAPLGFDTRTSPLAGYDGAQIGAFSAYDDFFTGRIAEIVMFDQALTCEERVAVGRDLSERFELEWSNLDGDVDLDCVCDPADCDDDDPARAPGLAEVPDDEVDQDCTGADTVTCYADADGDDYGDPAKPSLSGTGDCPAGQARGAGDCDDGSAQVNPAATEVAGNGIDDDCALGDDPLAGAATDPGCTCEAAPGLSPGLGGVVGWMLLRRRSGRWARPGIGATDVDRSAP